MTETTKRETRGEKQARTRAELIAAAATVFARSGYEGASVELIAEQAGYSHGAVYSNFAGKSDLFLAVFEQYMADRAQELAATQAGIEDGAPLEIRARALADQWMERFASDRESFLLHLEFLAASRRQPELAKRFGSRSAALRETIAAFIAHHQEEEGAEAPPPIRAGPGSARAGDRPRDRSAGQPRRRARRPLRRLRRAAGLDAARAGQMNTPAYNRMGLNYADFRQPDPRIEAAILGCTRRRPQRRQRRRGSWVLRAHRPGGHRGRALAGDDRPALAGCCTRTRRHRRIAPARRQERRRGDGRADDPPLAGPRGRPSRDASGSPDAESCC